MPITQTQQPTWTNAIADNIQEFPLTPISALSGDNDASEVWVFDSERLNQEPVCCLSLLQVIPIGFHGTWREG
jgi:hypothetical protein